MNEQAARIGVATAPGLPRLGAPFALFLGGKGGVGKTTLCANLGVHLAKKGRRVLLVDLDLGLANLDVALRLTTRRTLEDWFAGECALDDCLVRGPAGVDVLPAGSGSAEMGRPDSARRAQLFEELVRLSADYDLVLGDGSAGIGPDVLAFGCAAELVLVVTAPEPAALTDAYGVIKALDGHALEAGLEVPTPELVINLAAGAQEARATAAKLRAVCERFLARAPRQAGWMPRAREVSASAVRQRPFALEAPRSLACACLRELAGRLERLRSSRRERR